MAGPIPIHDKIPVSDSAVILAPARVSRRSMVIFNDSDERLYVKFEADVATNDFTSMIEPNWQGRMPWGGVYQGTVWGVWAAADPGRFAQVTELVG